MAGRLAACLFFWAAVAFAAPTLIPQPQSVEPREGEFRLGPETGLGADAAARPAAEFLAARLRASTGYPLKVGAEGGIRLTTDGADAALGPEGYELVVSPTSAVIRAPAPAGLFYGAQTLLQLLPSSGHAPSVRIVDRPRFRWRGLMLDVSRHFYAKHEVERILDAMASIKLNTFHWHLTDDQGWRIEIKKYPRLTSVGAWRAQSQLQSVVRPDYPKWAQPAIAWMSSWLMPYWRRFSNVHPAWAEPTADKFGPDGRYGGYYTQDDIREVVAYASARHITIVPEIEMPGHCVAALAAYPEFGCGGATYSTDVGPGGNRGVYDPSKDATFAFLEDVLDEVFALFPGRYVHIGGDEVSLKVKAEFWGKNPACQALMLREGLHNLDELQGWFIRRIDKFANDHGRTLIGWSEILQDGLPAHAALMDWIGGGAEAAQAGHDVVMTPAGFSYLDCYQSPNHAAEPHAAGTFLLLEKVYAFDPVPAGLAPSAAGHILGGQVNLWTEYVASLPHAEYMIFPRACAMAEVLWSPPARDWNDFRRRLAGEETRLDAAGVRYRP